MAENFRPNNTRWNAANNYDNPSDDPPSSSPADWTQNILNNGTEIAESSFLYEDLRTRHFFSSSSSAPANLRQPFLLFNEQMIDCRSPELDLRGVCREMQRGEGNETLKKFEVFGLESQFGRNEVQFADNISSNSGFYPSSFPPVGTMFFEVGPSSNFIFDKSSEEPREISYDESALKKPRIATFTTLPDFKVRKEKIGDRISALQKLVSPFGKTDRASVLHEAIEYIKFLHDQISVLSTPYLKKGHHKKEHKKAGRTNNEEARQELSSRGLCLVPISSTYPIADLWAPNFGRTYM